MATPHLWGESRTSPRSEWEFWIWDLLPWGGSLTFVFWGWFSKCRGKVTHPPVRHFLAKASKAPAQNIKSDITHGTDFFPFNGHYLMPDPQFSFFSGHGYRIQISEGRGCGLSTRKLVCMFTCVCFSFRGLRFSGASMTVPSVWLLLLFVTQTFGVLLYLALSYGCSYNYSYSYS